jgi:hypothetical protein
MNVLRAHANLSTCVSWFVLRPLSCLQNCIWGAPEFDRLCRVTRQITFCYNNYAMQKHRRHRGTMFGNAVWRTSLYLRGNDYGRSSPRYRNGRPRRRHKVVGFPCVPIAIKSSSCCDCLSSVDRLDAYDGDTFLHDFLYRDVRHGYLHSKRIRIWLYI